MADQEKNASIEGRVLFFDVEPSIVYSLKESFQEAGVLAYLSDDPGVGFKIAQKENIDIVLIDYYPEKTKAIDFLKTIKKKRSSTSRISLNQVQHRSEIIHLLLKGAITSYFEKPGGDEAILRSILHVLYARKTLKNKKLLELVGSADTLPTFPKTYHDFMNAIEKERSIKEISQIIEKDVPIATQILRIANSDFFRSGRIGSIERASIYLGLDIIKNIVFTVSLSSQKRLSATQKKYLEKIIYHSVQVNQNFQKVYTSQTGNKISDQYATIGITHDIGKIIILQYLPNRFNKILKYQKKNPDIGFYRSEIELGFKGQTHAEIGAFFLNLWNFPEPSVFTALFHHSTEEFSEPYKEILDIFSIVNDVANTGDGAQGNTK